MTRIIAALARLGSWRAPRALVLAMVLAGIVAAAPAHAQTNAVKTAAAPAKAVVLTPLSFINTKAMDFGKIATRNVATVVTINPATSVCTASPGAVRVGICQPAEFAGRGVLNAIVRLRVEDNSINLTGPGAPMLLDNFTADGGTLLTFLGAPGNPRYRILSLTGVFTFKVGGTLHVNANQAAGSYRGTFSVRADYQ
jgi:hypothetical protein